jgi:putative hydrolases of HD superfamily
LDSQQTLQSVFPHLRIFLSSDLQKIFDFIIELDKLKTVLRKTKPVGLDRYENIAEHSWQVCLLAQLLGKYAAAPLDIVRVTELLLVHDIPEIDIGDQIVYQTKDNNRAEAEREAAARIFGLLPEHQARRLMSRWQEYEDRKTSEAVFAYAIDRLMPILHNINNNGQSWRENRVPLEKIRAVNAVIADACPSVWEYVQDILVQLSKNGLFDYDVKHTRKGS